MKLNLDREELRKGYVDEGLEAKQLAERFNCSIASIKKWLRIFDIKKLRKNRKDLRKQRFGKLYVLRFSNRTTLDKLLWKCKCDCGKVVDVVYYSLLNDNTKSCGKCDRKREKSGTWKGWEGISGRTWYKFVRSSKIREIPFEISVKYGWDLFLKQDKKCALSGLELKMALDEKDRNYNASLDRIDSLKGYTVSNTQWVDKRINKMKHDLTEKEFIDLCKLVAKHN